MASAYNLLGIADPSDNMFETAQDMTPMAMQRPAGPAQGISPAPVGGQPASPIDIDIDQFSGTMRQKLHGLRQRAIEQSYFPNQPESFTGMFGESFRRGLVNEEFSKAHVKFGKLLAKQKTPEARAAYDTFREIETAYQQAQAQNPLEAPGLFRQMLIEGASSLPLMGKQIFADIVGGLALTAIGIMLEPTPVVEGLGLAKAASGVIGVKRTLGRVARAAKLGDKAKDAYGLGKKTMLAGKAVRAGMTGGTMVYNFFPEHYARVYGRLVDGGLDTEVADVAASLNGVISSLIEGYVSPARMVGIESGGALTKAADRAMIKIVGNAAKRGFLKWGARMVANFGGELLEEGAQGGTGNLISYLAAKSQDDPEVFQSVMQDISQEILDPDKQTIDGWRDIANGWDVFLKSAAVNMGEAWKGVAGLTLMGMPISGFNASRDVKRTTRMERQVGEMGEQEGVRQPVISDIRKAASSEGGYREQLAALLKLQEEDSKKETQRKAEEVKRFDAERLAESTKKSDEEKEDLFTRSDAIIASKDANPDEYDKLYAALVDEFGEDAADILVKDFAQTEVTKAEKEKKQRNVAAINIASAQAEEENKDVWPQLTLQQRIKLTMGKIDPALKIHEKDVKEALRPEKVSFVEKIRAEKIEKEIRKARVRADAARIVALYEGRVTPEERRAGISVIDNDATGPDGKKIIGGREIPFSDYQEALKVLQRDPDETTDQGLKLSDEEKSELKALRAAKVRFTEEAALGTRGGKVQGDRGIEDKSARAKRQLEEVNARIAVLEGKGKEEVLVPQDTARNVVAPDGAKWELYEIYTPAGVENTEANRVFRYRRTVDGKVENVEKPFAERFKPEEQAPAKSALTDETISPLKKDAAGAMGWTGSFTLPSGRTVVKVEYVAQERLIITITPQGDKKGGRIEFRFTGSTGANASAKMMFFEDGSQRPLPAKVVREILGNESADLAEPAVKAMLQATTPAEWQTAEGELAAWIDDLLTPPGEKSSAASATQPPAPVVAPDAGKPAAVVRDQAQPDFTPNDKPVRVYGINKEIGEHVGYKITDAGERSEVVKYGHLDDNGNPINGAVPQWDEVATLNSGAWNTTPPVTPTQPHESEETIRTLGEEYAVLEKQRQALSVNPARMSPQQAEERATKLKGITDKQAPILRKLQKSIENFRQKDRRRYTTPKSYESFSRLWGYLVHTKEAIDRAVRKLTGTDEEKKEFARSVLRTSASDLQVIAPVPEWALRELRSATYTDDSEARDQKLQGLFDYMDSQEGKVDREIYTYLQKNVKATSPSALITVRDSMGKVVIQDVLSVLRARADRYSERAEVFDERANYIMKSETFRTAMRGGKSLSERKDMRLRLEKLNNDIAKLEKEKAKLEKQTKNKAKRKERIAYINTILNGSKKVPGNYKERAKLEAQIESMHSADLEFMMQEVETTRRVSESMRRSIAALQELIANRQSGKDDSANLNPYLAKERRLMPLLANERVKLKALKQKMLLNRATIKADVRSIKMLKQEQEAVTDASSLRDLRNILRRMKADAAEVRTVEKTLTAQVRKTVRGRKGAIQTVLMNRLRDPQVHLLEARVIQEILGSQKRDIPGVIGDRDIVDAAEIAAAIKRIIPVDKDGENASSKAVEENIFAALDKILRGKPVPLNLDLLNPDAGDNVEGDDADYGPTGDEPAVTDDEGEQVDVELKEIDVPVVSTEEAAVNAAEDAAAAEAAAKEELNKTAAEDAGEGEPEATGAEQLVEPTVTSEEWRALIRDALGGTPTDDKRKLDIARLSARVGLDPYEAAEAKDDAMEQQNKAAYEQRQRAPQPSRARRAMDRTERLNEARGRMNEALDAARDLMRKRRPVKESADKAERELAESIAAKAVEVAKEVERQLSTILALRAMSGAVQTLNDKAEGVRGLEERRDVLVGVLANAKKRAALESESAKAEAEERGDADAFAEANAAAALADMKARVARAKKTTNVKDVAALIDALVERFQIPTEYEMDEDGNPANYDPESRGFAAINSLQKWNDAVKRKSVGVSAFRDAVQVVSYAIDLMNQSLTSSTEGLHARNVAAAVLLLEKAISGTIEVANIDNAAFDGVLTKADMAELSRIRGMAARGGKNAASASKVGKARSALIDSVTERMRQKFVDTVVPLRILKQKGLAKDSRQSVEKGIRQALAVQANEKVAALLHLAKLAENDVNSILDEIVPELRSVPNTRQNSRLAAVFADATARLANHQARMQRLWRVDKGIEKLNEWKRLQQGERTLMRQVEAARQALPGPAVTVPRETAAQQALDAFTRRTDIGPGVREMAAASLSDNNLSIIAKYLNPDTTAETRQELIAEVEPHMDRLTEPEPPIPSKVVALLKRIKDLGTYTSEPMEDLSTDELRILAQHVNPNTTATTRLALETELIGNTDLLQMARRALPYSVQKAVDSIEEGVMGRRYQLDGLGRRISHNQVNRQLTRAFRGFGIRFNLKDGESKTFTAGAFKLRVTLGHGETSSVDIQEGTADIFIDLDTATSTTVNHETLRHLGVAGMSASNLNILARHLNIDTTGLARLDLEEAIVQRMDELEQSIASATPRVRAIFNSLKQFVAAVARALGIDWNPNDPMTELDRLAKKSALLSSVMSGEAMSETLGAQPQTALTGKRNQIVNHGSPHTFLPEPGFPHGRFRLDKIGTGEGGAAYGWGVYFADIENVAKTYARRTQTGGVVRPMSSGPLANVEILDSKPGSLYNLSIPDEVMPKLLDWDKSVPLETEQKIIALLKDDGWNKTGIIQAQRAVNPWARGLGYGEGPLTGDMLYGYLVRILNGKQAASEFLARAGMPGLKYLDQGSRTSDFEVWRNEETGKYFISDHKGDPNHTGELAEDRRVAGLPEYDTPEQAEVRIAQIEQVTGKQRTSNYVIWDQPTLDSIALLKRNGERLDATRNEAESLSQGGGVSPAAEPPSRIGMTPGIRYQFGGEKGASAAQLVKLSTAKSMESDGDSDRDIWRKTGWWRGFDGKWRFEINDSKMKMTASAPRSGRITDLVTHPDLFSAYPDLATMTFSVAPGAKLDNKAIADYNPSTNHMRISESAFISGKEELLDTISHELAHGVQELAGLTGGGNLFSRISDERDSQPAAWRAGANKLLQRLFGVSATEAASLTRKFQRTTSLSDLHRSSKASPSIASSYSYYERIAGEVEARLVEARRRMSASARSRVHPHDMIDVPLDDVIVRTDFNKMLAEIVGPVSFNIGMLDKVISAIRSGQDDGGYFSFGDMIDAPALVKRYPFLKAFNVAVFPAGFNSPLSYKGVEVTWVVNGGEVHIALDEKLLLESDDVVKQSIMDALLTQTGLQGILPQTRQLATLEMAAQIVREQNLRARSQSTVPLYEVTKFEWSRPQLVTTTSAQVRRESAQSGIGVTPGIAQVRMGHGTEEPTIVDRLSESRLAALDFAHEHALRKSSSPRTEPDARVRSYMDAIERVYASEGPDTDAARYVQAMRSAYDLDDIDKVVASGEQALSSLHPGGYVAPADRVKVTPGIRYQRKQAAKTTAGSTMSFEQALKVVGKGARAKHIASGSTLGFTAWVKEQAEAANEKTNRAAEVSMVDDMKAMIEETAEQFKGRKNTEGVSARFFPRWGRKISAHWGNSGETNYLYTQGKAGQRAFVEDRRKGSRAEAAVVKAAHEFFKQPAVRAAAKAANIWGKIVEKDSNGKVIEGLQRRDVITMAAMVEQARLREALNAVDRGGQRAYDAWLESIPEEQRGDVHRTLRGFMEVNLNAGKKDAKGKPLPVIWNVLSDHVQTYQIDRGRQDAGWNLTGRRLLKIVDDNMDTGMRNYLDTVVRPYFDHAEIGGRMLEAYNAYNPKPRKKIADYVPLVRRFTRESQERKRERRGVEEDPWYLVMPRETTAEMDLDLVSETQQRMWSTAGFIIHGIDELMMRHGRDAAKYVGWNEIANKHKAALKTNADLIDSSFGSEYTKEMLDAWADVEGSMDTRANALEKVFTALLGINAKIILQSPRIWLYQPVSVLSYGRLLGFGNLAWATANRMSPEARKAIAAIRDLSPEVWQRYELAEIEQMYLNESRYANEYMQATGTAPSTSYGKYRQGTGIVSRNLSKGMTVADRIAIDLGILTAYSKVKRENPGLSATEIYQRTADEAADAMHSTQVSSNILNMTGARRGKTAWGKAFTFMTGATSAAYNMIARDVIEVSRSGGRDEVALQNLARSAIALTVQAMLIGLVKTFIGGKGDDDDDKVSEDFFMNSLNSMLGYIPAAGPITPDVMYGVAKLANSEDMKRKYGWLRDKGVASVPFRSLDQLSKGLGQLTDAAHGTVMRDGKPEKMSRKVQEARRQAGIRNTTRGAWQLLDLYNGINSEGIARLAQGMWNRYGTEE